MAVCDVLGLCQFLASSRRARYVKVVDRSSPPSEEDADFRVLIAGGGTGGHLFPGVALAQRVLARGGSVTFAGTARGIEARVIPDLGWSLDLLDVAGIKGGGVTGLFKGLGRLPRAFIQSLRILRRRRPTVVVGVGGYASGPLVATAALIGVPCVILEQNSVPGITNRILSRLVRRVFTTFPDTRGDFPAKKIRRLGNPIRDEFLSRLQDGDPGAPRGGARRLFVFGGSQGAKALNEAVLGCVPELLRAVPDLEVWHQTGARMKEAVEQGYAAAGMAPQAARVSAFIEDMSAPYRWCDLVLCRAGATSLAELAVVGCPAVLVPFPFAADNHQEHNAKALVDAGGAQMVLERDLSPGALAELLESLLSSPATLDEMRVGMRRAGRPGAGAEICAELRGLGAG